MINPTGSAVSVRALSISRKLPVTILGVLFLAVYASIPPAWARESPWPGNRQRLYTFLDSDLPLWSTAFDSDPTMLRAGREAGNRGPSPESPVWGAGEGKSYLVPALEIPGFILALNGFSRLAFPNKRTNEGTRTYASTPSTFWDHLVHGPWVIDNDSFGVNQLGHPYQGSIYFGFGRSAGLSYWESAGYTFLGSILWELGGETSKPSINDQVASGIAGAFFGEPLFRISSLLLESGPPGFWRELGAAAICPPAGFNRLVFGERFDGIFPSRNPAFFWSAGAGLTVNTSTKGGSSRDFDHNEAAADFSMSYGLPGKAGYRYARPFDYFQFDLALVSNVHNALENVMTRGLLFGDDYEVGENYRGIWGLYGSYEYVSPHTFRVSTTALSVGTTAQCWLSHLLALQGSALVGLGYGAGGNISGVAQRTYHYGGAGQALLSFRLILSDMAALSATGRLYHIHDTLSTAPRGTETIGRVDVGLTWRVYGPHAVGVRYRFNSRDGDYASLPDQHQRMSTFSLTYDYLSDTGFGAVEWRREGTR